MSLTIIQTKKKNRMILLIDAERIFDKNPKFTSWLSKNILSKLELEGNSSNLWRMFILKTFS